MKKFFLMVLVIFSFLSENVYASKKEYFKCSYEGHNYEQVIKLIPGGYYLMLRDMHDNSKLEHIKEEGFVYKYNIIVIDGNRSYELNGVSPSNSLEEKYIIFFGKREIISLYLKAFELDPDRENFKDYYITSTSNTAPKRIMRGTCKRFD